MHEAKKLARLTPALPFALMQTGAVKGVLGSSGVCRWLAVIEYFLRSANVADVPGVSALVNAAYGHYVERLGMLPRPMTEDYSEVIANQRVTVAESSETIVGLIVLAVDDEVFLIDNLTVDPRHRGKGHGRALLEFAEAKLGARGSTPYTYARTRR